MTSSKSAARNSRYPLGNTDALKTFILVECPFTEPHHTVREGDTLQPLYLQPIITQYFIDNKSEIWLLFLIAHSKR